MSVFDKALGFLGLQRKAGQKASKRGYNIAGQNRLTGDWLAPKTSADAEIRSNLAIAIDRSRDHERNNPYFRRYLNTLCNNVIGPEGIGLQMKVRNLPTAKSPKGDLDQGANDRIEAGWWEWSRPENCTVQRNISRVQLEHLALRCTARDGGFLYRHIRGKRAGNRFNYALQIFEIDQLDLDFHSDLPDGRIRFGVEADNFGNVRAFHLLTIHPGDFGLPTGKKGQYRERISADEMGMLFFPERVGQTVGFPWGASTAVAFQMLNGYQEAELVGRRVAACKGGFFTSENPANYQGDGVDSAGNIVTDAQPGVFEQLPAGTSFTPYDPQHSTDFPAFVKTTLRTAASGLDMSYVTLANDLEGVNYSSIRAGVLEDREAYKSKQNWFVSAFETVIFEAWLEMALTSNALGGLPVARFDKFNQPEFKPRRWSWVDPLKDIQAAEAAIALRITSRRQVIAEAGGDVNEVFADNRDDEALADAMGIELVAPETLAKMQASQNTVDNEGTSNGSE